MSITFNSDEKDHFDITDFIESTIEPQENVYNSLIELEDWVLEEALTTKNMGVKDEF